MSKNIHRDNLRAFIVEKIAEKRGLKKNSVYRILNGARDNMNIICDYVEVALAVEKAVDSVLLNEVNKLVPFYQPFNPAEN